jgi:hypothetical protein
MKLEAVGGVSMGDLGFEIGRQVDDMNCPEGAFLRTNATSNAKSLGDEGDFRLGRNLDTELASSHDGAGLLAFLTTFLKLIS